MLDEFDPTELIDLIEGELDAPAARALSARLARDPAARATVETIMRDRAVLRSLGHPELPAGLLARLEPLLARPMLIESHAQPAPRAARPGEFRRQVAAATRSNHRVRWG